MTRPPELRVPDLTPAPSSVIDVHGNVGCIICGRRLRLADVDVVGLGFRCRPCSLRAAVDGSDEAAHLSEHERPRLARGPRPAALAAIGLGLLAIAAVMWLTGFDLASHGEEPESLFVYVFLAGTSCLGVAWFRWRDHRTGHGD